MLFVSVSSVPVILMMMMMMMMMRQCYKNIQTK